MYRYCAYSAQNLTLPQIVPRAAKEVQSDILQTTVLGER
jgi:hypothetical protein